MKGIMDPTAILAIGLMVSGVVQLLKLSPLPTTGLIPVGLVLGISAFGVLIWAVSFEPAFERHLLWSYLTGWLAVSTTAAGAWGLTRKTAAEVKAATSG